VREERKLEDEREKGGRERKEEERENILKMKRESAVSKP
jgi:hypothetical protein